MKRHFPTEREEKRQALLLAVANMRDIPAASADEREWDEPEKSRRDGKCVVGTRRKRTRAALLP